MIAIVGEIHKAIGQVCPIHGVSVGNLTDRATWRVDYDPAATEAQRTAAANVITSFNVEKPIPPASISDRQFFQQLAVAGIITEEQALAANAAVIPPPLLAIVDELPADQQFGVKMLISGATVFERHNPITGAIGQTYGMTADEIDVFFIDAAQL